MASQLQTDREAVLILYLANELEAEDRAQVEQLLGADPALRADLERVSDLHEQMIGGLKELDSRPLHMSADISTRRVMREMRKFQLELNTRAPVQLEASSIRAWPRWIYPVGAAAAIFFVVLGLWGVNIIDFQPNLAEQERSRMPRYEQEEFPMYRDQLAQERLQRILLASFGVEETDHPAELDEGEDPAALETTSG